MNKVVVAYDFSPYARRALALALQGFPFGEGRVVVFHACPERVFQEGFSDAKIPSVEEIEAYLAAEIEAVGQELPGPIQKGVSTEIFVASGHPSDQVLKYMGSQSCVALLLGGQGHGGLGEIFLGRTAQRVLRKADFPVLVVKNTSRNSELPKNILCAVDYGNPSRVALQTAARLAAQRKAGLAVIHVVDSPYIPYLQLMDVDLETDVAVRELLNEAPGKLTGFVEEVLGKEVEFSSETCYGPTSRMIASHAENMGVDLIVAASHGRSALERVMMGSVAEGLVQKASMDVLVIRAD